MPPSLTFVLFALVAKEIGMCRDIQEGSSGCMVVSCDEDFFRPFWMCVALMLDRICVIVYRAACDLDRMATTIVIFSSFSRPNRVRRMPRVLPMSENNLSHSAWLTTIVSNIFAKLLGSEIPSFSNASHTAIGSAPLQDFLSSAQMMETL